MGIKDLTLQNKALGAKLVWRMIKNPKAKWVKILRYKYLLGEEEESVCRSDNYPTGSRIWNFIKECKDIVLESLSWDVKSGNKALFWDDSWGGKSALHEILGNDKLIELIKHTKGEWVKDYFSQINNSEGSSWAWKSLEELRLPLDFKNKLNKALQE